MFVLAVPFAVCATADELDDLQQVAKRGTPADQFRYAEALELNGRYSQAAEWYKRAAGSHAEAQLAIGTLLLEGRGVSENPVKAARFLKKAAKAGLAQAQYLLGLQYQEGNGVGYDAKLAARWLREAAESGHPAAQMRAGLMALNGVGMPRDTQSGLAWLESAGEGGDEIAQLNLGLFYMAGKSGVARDPARAAAWFLKAAEHRNALALYNLGALYARGEGVEQDVIEAYKWFELSRLAGDETAEAARDQIAAALTVAGIKHAGQRVDAWIGAHR